MNTYVISDIHGCYNDFIEMLKKINFTENDQLILAGDYIDRGVQNFEMLEWLRNAPENVIAIKGNHDVEFAQCIKIIFDFIKKLNIKADTNEDLFKIYSVIKNDFNSKMFDYYGTLERLIYNNNITLSDLLNWEQMINNMPYYFKISINKIKHIVTHAGYISKKDFYKIQKDYDDIESFYIYSREDSLKHGGQENSIIIFGHTPTVMYSGFYNNGEIYRHINRKINCEFYNIDCGKVYYSEKYKNAKLACIRLEDKKFFYL